MAVEDDLSPAVWSPGADLPIPSLFQAAPQRIPRSASPEENETKLAAFPVICLPTNLIPLPHLYCLLNHEVGHAVDEYLQLTKQIWEKLPSNECLPFWRAWMRELVADTIGISLSGPAYVFALAEFFLTHDAPNDLLASSAYPGRDLRLYLLQQIVVTSGYPHDPDLDKAVRNVVDSGSTQSAQFQSLLKDFKQSICPIVVKICFHPSYQQDLRTFMESASDLPRPTAWPGEANLHFLPSILVHAQEDVKSAWNDFRNIIQGMNPPPWAGQNTYTPALRPTYLDGESQIKVPPAQLLIHYNRIAFVGATHSQLCKSLRKAFQTRERQPWKQIEIFFADDALLTYVEYADAADKLQLRNRALKELRKLFEEEPLCESWCLYEYTGTAVFASFWDWNEPGGRIHISPQLLGTDIRQCPSTDYVWYGNHPTPAYQSLRKHLEQLRNGADVLRSCLDEVSYF